MEARRGEGQVEGASRVAEREGYKREESVVGEEGNLCGRSSSPLASSRGRPLQQLRMHDKTSQLEGGVREEFKASDDADQEAAPSSAQEAEDRGVEGPQPKEGGEQADLIPTVAGRESEAISSRVSPSTMIQAMNAARVLLEKVDEERMQSTAVDVSKLSHDGIFPLPLPPCRSERSGKACEQMVYGLNHLAIGHGHGPVPSRSPVGLTENLSMLCERFDVWERSMDPVDFDSFFRKRGVTYAGEEIRLAQTLSWEAVCNSLPEQVGQLKLVDFCTEGTLHYVEHLEEFLIPTDTMVRAKPPKVMVGDDWSALSRGLVERGICEVWPMEKLYHVGQEPLLNGLFAVGKGEFVGPFETQRLIMNLNPVQHPGPTAFRSAWPVGDYIGGSPVAKAVRVGVHQGGGFDGAERH